jgi:hypothetical protein
MQDSLPGNVLNDVQVARASMVAICLNPIAGYMSDVVMKEINPSECPLCQQPNHCALIKSAKDCWCLHVQIPVRRLMQIPPSHIGKACLCQACATAPLQSKPAAQANKRPEPIRVTVQFPA